MILGSRGWFGEDVQNGLLSFLTAFKRGKVSWDWLLPMCVDYLGRAIVS